MAKVHLIEWKRQYRELYFTYLFCGLSGPENKIEMTKDPQEATCKTCLKAYEAWKRRQREA